MPRENHSLDKKDAAVLFFFAILLAGKWWTGKDLPSVGDETNFIVMVEEGLYTLSKSVSFLETVKALYFFSPDYPPLYLWISSFFYKLFATPLAGTRLLNVFFMFLTTTSIYAVIKFSTKNRLLAFWGCAILFASPEWIRTLAIMDTCLTAVVFILFYLLVRVYHSESPAKWHYLSIGLMLAIGFLVKFSFIIYAFPLTATFILLEIAKRKCGFRSSALAVLYICLPPMLLALPWYGRALLGGDNFVTKYTTGILLINQPDGWIALANQIVTYAGNFFPTYAMVLLCLTFVLFALAKKDVAPLSGYTLPAAVSSFLFISVFLLYVGRYWIPRWNLSAHMVIIIACVLLASIKIRATVKNIVVAVTMLPLLVLYPAYFMPKINSKLLMERSDEHLYIGDTRHALKNTKIVFETIDMHFAQNKINNACVMYFFDPNWIMGYTRTPNPELISRHTLYNIFPRLLESALQNNGHFYFVVGKEWRDHPEVLRWHLFFKAWDAELWSYFEKLPDAPTKPGLGQEIYYTNASRFPLAALEMLASAARRTDTEYPLFHSLTEARYKLENGNMTPLAAKEALLQGVHQWQDPENRWRSRNDVLNILDAMQSLARAYWERVLPKPFPLADENIFLVRGNENVPVVRGESIAEKGGAIQFRIAPPQGEFAFVRISFRSPGGYANVTYLDDSKQIEMGAYDPSEGSRAVIYPLPHISPLESIFFTITSGSGEYYIDSIEFF